MKKSILMFIFCATLYSANAQKTKFQVDSIAPVGLTPNANAATLTGSTLNLEPASASFPGVVTTAAQTFAGQKTINMASSGAVTQNLILDNTATAAVNSATSMAQSVAGVQRGEFRTTLTEIVGGGADFAKTEIKAQDGGALKTGVSVEMKNAGVDNVAILPSNDGAFTTARRFVQPYTTLSITGATTLTAGHQFIYLEDGGLAAGTHNLTLPTTAEMLDGEILRIICNDALPSGTNLQFILAGGQTYNGSAPGSIGFLTGGSGQINKNVELQFIGGDWRQLKSN